jgi:hypothetical protein
VRIFDGHTDVPLGETCGFDIDPHSVQVWPLEGAIGLEQDAVRGPIETACQG